MALTTMSLPGMKLWILASIDDSFARRPMSSCQTVKYVRDHRGRHASEAETQSDGLCLDDGVGMTPDCKHP